MGTVSYIHTRNHMRCSMCDECNSPLLEIGEELYCPVCDVGERVKPDSNGETTVCARCDTALAPWFPYACCPSCFTGNKSGAHKTAKRQ
jgi:hypothetical protein